jgi:aryl-alcohol dehydrogenase-like predicted oxidoreductase
MQYTTLGASGLLVSRLAFGAMTFGHGELVLGVRNTIDQKQADRMVAHALAAGVNLFDTADAYCKGESEEILGKALHSCRQEVIICTKVGFRTSEILIDTGLSYRRIIACAERSLKRLGTDYIDLYLIHIPDPLTPAEETLRALDDLVRRGMVRYTGYSNLPAWQAADMLGVQQANRLDPFVCAQMYYSLVGRDIEHEVLPFVHQAGLGLMVWSPLASGFLSGKYSRENPLPSGTRREKFSFPPVDTEKGYEVVDALKEIAAGHGASSAQVALAWLLTRPGVSTVIVGASRFSQMEDNLQASDLVLGREEIDRLDTLTAPVTQYPGYMTENLSWDAKVKAALWLPPPR